MTKDGTSIIAIHVDDMLACASSDKEMLRLKTDLESFFEIKDLGDVHWLLRVTITRDWKARTISFSQAVCILIPSWPTSKCKMVTWSIPH
jgi:hypothetical protein